MSRQLEIVDTEIKSIEDLLKGYSFHLYALREMRDTMRKVSAPTKLIEAEAKVVSPQKVVKKKPNKIARTHGLYTDAAKYARKIGAIIRIDKVNKIDAVRRVIADGQLPIHEKSMSAMVNPSYLVLESYNRAFRGTKYVKQD